MSDLTEFSVTADHLALLQAQRLIVGGEPGAPLRHLDPERPFGSDDPERDVAEILGLDYDPFVGLAPADAAYVAALMETVSVAADIAVQAGAVDVADYVRATIEDLWEMTTA